MIKRKPLIAVILVTFWIGYVGFSVTSYVRNMSDVVNELNSWRAKMTDYQNYIAAPLMVEGQIDALQDNLEKAQAAGLFDFFLLKKGTKVIASYNYNVEEAKSDGQDPNEFPLGISKLGDQYIATTISVPFGEVDYTLTTGIEAQGGKYIARTLYNYRWDFVQDFVIVTTFLGLLLFLMLKDILDLTKILRSQNRSQAQLVKVRTKEADVLLAVTSQYEKMSKSLKLSNDMMSESLSPAVRYELSQGTEAPHLFPAIVVRVDVNGYTQMYLERKDEFVTTTLNTYFQRASEIIHRYGGHIYQFVGDEIVFHFKELDMPNAKARALGCVRSLFEVAQDMDYELKSKGIPFIVKASMVRGRLRFVKLDTGYAFAGLPLIESVRMLGKIEERDTNIVALYGDDFQGLEEMAVPFKRLAVAFKGFSKQSEIVEVRDFASVEGMLDAGVWSDLPLYRSDRDLASILHHLATHLPSLSKEQFLDIYKSIRDFSIQRVGGDVANRFSELFVAADQLAIGSQPKDFTTVILASVTHLASVLLKSGAFDERIRQIMEKNLEHIDQRVRANTIVALDELSPETYSFREMFSLPFNRAAADALLVEGRREYTPEVHSFLKNFLKSEDPFFMASALYVLGALFEHHRQVDSVYFKANSLIQDIPELIEEYLNHADPMVARRAQMTHNQLQSLASAA